MLLLRGLAPDAQLDVDPLGLADELADAIGELVAQAEGVPVDLTEGLPTSLPAQEAAK